MDTIGYFENLGKREMRVGKRKLLFLVASFLALFMFSSIFGFTQEDKEKERAPVKIEGDKANSEPTEMSLWDESNLPYVEATYRNGKPEGEAIVRYNDGSRFEGKYVSGVKNGQWTKYNPEGKIVRQEFYLNGIKHGKFIRWSEKNGRLLSEENFKNGQLHGKQISWYVNGVKHSEGDFIFGSGKTKTWYPSGKLSTAHELKNGNFYGIEIWLYESGKMKRETVYDENGRVKKRTHWFENGEIRFEEDNKNGKYSYKEWDKEGKLIFNMKSAD